MRTRVAGAIAKIKKNEADWVHALNSCPDLKERYKKFAELVPEASDWPRIVVRELIFQIHCAFGVDFGICEHYFVDDHRQYCRYDGRQQECECFVPQPFCVFRDRDGQPKYPELMPARRS